MQKRMTLLLMFVALGVIGLAACMPSAATPTAVPPTTIPTIAPTAVPPTKAPDPTKPPTVAPSPVPTVAPTKAPVADANTLVAAPVTTGPKLTALADDTAWANAAALKVAVASGANFKGGATDATLKAVYTSDSIYFLLQYDDPTLSVRRSPFIKQADGSWKKLADPDDKGGDNNKYYEDKASLIWNANSSIKGFDSAGCFAFCHAGDAGKPYGNMYTAAPGELGDMWHWKSVRTGPVNQVDDQYLDDTRYDKDKSPEAGRKSDAKTAGGYTDIALKDGKPEFMSKDAKPANAGGTYWLLDSDKVAFDDSKFKPGDEVASIRVAPITGDRGDISAVGAWKDGKYTVAMSRKLVTGSKTDVQFDKLDGTYTFGLALFDNASVRHAYNNGALTLQFSK